jgi:5-carboxymethyl-2-hydroxymuconate isomerase
VFRCSEGREEECKKKIKSFLFNIILFYFAEEKGNNLKLRRSMRERERERERIPHSFTKQLRNNNNNRKFSHEF